MAERPIALPPVRQQGAQIRDCLERADDCDRRATVQSDPGLRDDFQRLAKRWRDLARSMELAERLGSFTKISPKQNGHLSG